MSKELQTWFKRMPNKLQRDFARDLRAIADRLANDIKTAAPLGETGNLRDSVRVTRGRNTLELFVDAGGPMTTKEVRAGSGVSYDYALAIEFGTSKMKEQPFFYTTYRQKREEVRAEIEKLVVETIERS